MLPDQSQGQGAWSQGSDSWQPRSTLSAQGQGEADGIFIPCPRWPTIGDVALLEEETGKPVITSSLACIWHALKLIDIKENVSGYGRLMASLGN